MNHNSKILSIVIVLLVSVTVWAQEPVGNRATVDPHLQDHLVMQHDINLMEGDTIIIRQSQNQYLTGETISDWVHYVKHIIQSVGGKRFPSGVLIQGIMSWLAPEDLYLASSAHGTEQEAPVEKEPAPIIEQLAPVEEEPVSEVVEVVSEEPKTNEQVETVPATEEVVVEEVVEETKEVAIEEAVAEPVKEPVKEKYVPAQCDRLSVALRGGAASHMHDAPAIGNWKLGYNAMLDLQYAHYWISRKENAYGLLTGLSIGYTESGVGNRVDSTYSVVAGGQHIDYTIRASNIREQDGALQLEIPIMFAMVMKNGFYLNVGPKIAVPVYKPYRQTISEPDIQAVFTDMGGVVVRNEAVTGYVDEGQLKTRGRWNNGTLSIRLGADLGYEWRLSQERAISLGAYATYGVFNLRKNETNGQESLICVTPPSADAAASVTINSASDTYARGVGYFDAGIKVGFHFNLPK